VLGTAGRPVPEYLYGYPSTRIITRYLVTRSVPEHWTGLFITSLLFTQHSMTQHVILKLSG